MKYRSVFVFVLIAALLLPTMVSAQAGTYPNPGTSVTNIVVQNTSTTAGNVATVQVQYYDTEGNLDHTRTGVSIDPKAVKEIKTEDETVLGDGWAGSAVMSSDTPLAAIVSVKNTNVPVGDGVTQGAYNGTNEPANTLYFPSVYGFQYIVSRLSVQNTEATDAEVTLSFFRRDGTPLGTKVATIKAYAQRTFYLGNTADLPTAWPADFMDGSVTVTSLNKLAGAAVTTWSNRSGAYQALTDNNKGTTLYAPSLYRFKYNPPAGFNPLTDQFTIFSAINIQNTSATASAHITATFYSRGGTGVPVLVIPYTVPPSSAVGMNLKNGGDLPATTFAPLTKGSPFDWDGSVTVVSDQPVVGVGITSWEDAINIDSGVYAMVTPNDGASSLFVPAQYRLDWGSGWAQWSAINLQNVGATTVSKNDLTIQYIDTNGVQIASFTGVQLPFDLASGAALGLNTRNGGDLNASAFAGFPTVGGFPRFIGGIYITGPAGSQLVGVANIIYNNRASVYNAFPGE